MRTMTGVLLGGARILFVPLRDAFEDGLQRCNVICVAEELADALLAGVSQTLTLLTVEQ